MKSALLYDTETETALGWPLTRLDGTGTLKLETIWRSENFWEMAFLFYLSDDDIIIINHLSVEQRIMIRRAYNACVNSIIVPWTDDKQLDWENVILHNDVCFVFILEGRNVFY